MPQLDLNSLGYALFTIAMGAWGAYKARQQHRKAKSKEAIAEAPESIQPQLQEAAGKSAPETIRAFTALALTCQDLAGQLEIAISLYRDLETRFVVREQEQQEVIRKQGETIREQGETIEQQQQQIDQLRAEVEQLRAELGGQAREASL